MNDLDILIRAEKYISDLANGKDPLTGAELGDEQIVNNVRISRCLFYVSGVLKKVIDNGGEVNAAPAVKPKRSELADFALTDEQALALKPENYDISAKRLTEMLNDLIDLNCMKKLGRSVIPNWLTERGLLQDVVINGQNRKKPTAAGEELGITEKMFGFGNNSHKGVVYSPDAQRFIFDNIDSIIAFASSDISSKVPTNENAGKPWTQDDDEHLSEMYNEGHKIRELCAEFGRTMGSITARLAKLGFDVKSAYTRTAPNGGGEGDIPPDISFDENYTPENFDDVPLPSEPGGFGLDESSPYFGKAAIPNEEVDEDYPFN